VSTRVRLIGRTGELDRLTAALGNSDKQSGLVYLEGEAGAGKTRLLDEALTAVDETACTIVRAVPRSGDLVRPFALLITAFGSAPRAGDAKGADLAELLAENVPGGVAASLPAGQLPEARYRVLDALLDLVSAAAAEKPLVIALDDLHRADAASLSVLAGLALRIDDGAEVAGGFVTLVLASRPPSVGDSTLGEIRALAAARGALVELDPLGPVDVGELLAELTGCVPGDRLLEEARRAGGNPLLVRALVDLASERAWLVIDEGVVDLDEAAALRGAMADLLLARVAGLSAAAREVLRAATVLGSAFSLVEVAALLDQPPPSVIAPADELIRAGLVEEVDDQLGFRHDLIREAVYDEIAPWAREALHAQAAAMLTQREAPASDIARHLLDSGASPAEGAAQWFHRAGRTLLHTDPSAASDLLVRARELSDRPSAELVADLVLAYAWTDRAATGEALAREALGYPDVEAVIVRAALARTLFVQGRLIEAADELDRIATEHERVGELTEARRARAEVALVRALAFQGEQARVDAATVLDDLDDDADLVDPASRATACVAWCARSWAMANAALADESVVAAHRAIEAASDDADALRVNPHYFLAYALFAADRFDEFDDAAGKGRDIGARAGTVWQLPVYSSTITGKHLRAGEWDRALAESEAGLSWARDTGSHVGVPWLWCYQALIALWRDDIPLASELLQHAEDDLAGELRPGLDGVLWTRGLLAEASGDEDAAHLALSMLWDLVEGLGVVTRMPLIGADAIRIALASGATDLVDRVMARLARCDLTVSPPTFAAGFLRCRGLAEADAELLLASVEAHSATAALVERSFVSGEAALALAAAGRNVEAGELATTALGIDHELGAGLLAERLIVGLAAEGLDLSSAGPASGPAQLSEHLGLTPAEWRVALLVAEGRNNPEIAEALFVSRRTVESHLSHVFTKLGLRSRVELAVAVRDHQ
jgi:DNA-binding CsgD family transcriptional regulator